MDDGIPAVLTPEQAVIAAKRLGARHLVPIHYGQPDPPSYIEIDHPLERLKAAAGALPLIITPVLFLIAAPILLAVSLHAAFESRPEARGR